MDAAARRPAPGIAARVRRWSRSLMRGRKPEPLPVRLDSHRFYIVPTRAGFGFAILLVTMLVGALNYQNNAALLLTCMLGAALASSMLLTWRELHDLNLRSLHADHGFCDARLPLHLAFADDRHARHGLRISIDKLEQPCPLEPGNSVATVTMPTERRGWTPLPRLQVSSTLPFGLFRAWSWITPAQQVLVYPRILRDVRPPVRLVLNALSGLDRETRISRLTGWVCDAYAAAHPWILVLEDRGTMGPAADAAHYHRCLTALAELP
jgi:uncharacterized protein (DUF58 family)